MIGPAAALEGGEAAAVAVPDLAAQVVGGDRGEPAEVGHGTPVHEAVVAAGNQVVVGVARCQPDVADAGVVVRLVPGGLALEDALHPPGRGGELGDAVAAGEVVVARRQVESDEGHVVLPRQAVGIDLLLQVEQAGQVPQQLDEHLHHRLPLGGLVDRVVLDQLPGGG